VDILEDDGGNVDAHDEAYFAVAFGAVALALIK
jgi:hypothetical protein